MSGLNCLRRLRTGSDTRKLRKPAGLSVCSHNGELLHECERPAG
jgi:hypothetical protein